MVDDGIFATTAEVQRRINVNANTNTQIEAFINQFIASAEALINFETTFDWTAAFSSLDAATRDILKMAAVEMAALMAEATDPDIIGRPTATFSANVHIHLYNLCIKELNVKDKQKFLRNL